MGTLKKLHLSHVMLRQQVGRIRTRLQVLEGQPLVEPHQGELQRQPDLHPAGKSQETNFGGFTSVGL